MSFVSILYTTIIGPLYLLFEVIFSLVHEGTDNIGLTIVVMSLLINLLVLPLYKRADAMQEEERDIQKKLYDGVSHIKKTFRGDEKMLILQTYYRQNDYKPTYVLRGAVSLFLEIPFFIAAYQFLSHLSILNGVTFGPISDLGAADAMIVVGSISINVLPIIMTAVNIISTAIFTKGHPLKTKLQLYGMALFFLVFLYTSPSGLVLYWTLNNIFSLLKTIYYKLNITEKIFSVLRKSKQNEKVQAYTNKEKGLFISSTVALTIMLGFWIPCSIIGSSPADFNSVISGYHPVWYIVSALCLSVGTFLIWVNVFYSLADFKAKIRFGRAFSALFSIAIANYMIFSQKFGMLSATMVYDDELGYDSKEIIFNLCVLLVIVIVVVLLAHKNGRILTYVYLVSIVAMVGVSLVDIRTIINDVDAIEVRNSENDELARIPLSKNGRNVVVIMLDRAQGEYVPYIMDERPELIEKFDGFKYYDNTVSTAFGTLYASPALWGGYDYTVENINKRSEDLLVDKQNEALKVMPRLFSSEGFDITICDPTYAGYQLDYDLSIFDDTPEYHTYNTRGKFENKMGEQSIINKMNRNIFCFALMKSMPLLFQEALYQEGEYCNADYAPFVDEGIYHSDGMDPEFMDYYLVLDNLPEMSVIEDDSSDNFLMMSNDTPHMPILTQLPDYEPSLHVDNTPFADTNKKYLEHDGHRLEMENISQVQHFHVNVATFMKLGEWFDFMRENGVYDNTRIILVSDHGFDLNQQKELVFDFGEEDPFDVAEVYPLLMVKDFNSTGFTTDSTFMTNADVTQLAVDDIVDNPVNPFTGNPIDDSAKNSDLYVFASDWGWTNLLRYDGDETQFHPNKWYSVHDSIWNRDNWKLITDEALFPTEE